MAKRGQGWYNEREAHGLCAKGIKVRKPRMKASGRKHPYADETKLPSKWLSKFEKEYGMISNVSTGDGRGLIIETDDGYEFVVFEDWDSARERAIDLVRDDLDDDPSMFTQDWLQYFIYITNTDRRIIAGEEADFMVEDMDDDGLIRDSEVEDEYNVHMDEYDELDDERLELEVMLDKKKLSKSEKKKIDDRIDELEDKLIEMDKEKEILVNIARDEFISDRYDEIYEALDDPIEYFVRDRGIYTEAELLEQNFIGIDVDKASVDAVDTDGVAHFLSNYDGDEVEFDGKYLYRIG